MWPNKYPLCFSGPTGGIEKAVRGAARPIAYRHKKRQKPLAGRGRCDDWEWGVSGPCGGDRMRTKGIVPGKQPPCPHRRRKIRRAFTAFGNDEGLAEVIDAWPELPPALKDGIPAMVRAAR